jgi:hypothetical protein
MQLFLVKLCLAAMASVCDAQRGKPREPPMEVYQAAVPPRQSLSDPACCQHLFTHEFANSYDAPFVGAYRPPTDCKYTTTILRLSVSSKGRQYDRLAFLFFGDVEVWRTSTAMPTRYGIYWTFAKDVTFFDVLLRKEQKIIFDLGNLVDGKLYTGAWNVTLEALYFDDDYGRTFEPAHQVYALSNMTSGVNKPSVFSLPGDGGMTTVTLPRNVKSAVVSLLASGNGAEEFWWGNVPSEYVKTFPENEDPLPGYSPFREVQLLVDGQLAGVSWPFPILFTGGVDPGAWRPVVGIDSFDLSSFEIDVTPWLSLLCDGKPHTFQFKVVGYDSSLPGNIGPVGDNWYVTGSLWVWLDATVNQTVAGSVMSEITTPTFSLIPKLGAVTTVNGTSTNSSLHFDLKAQRSLRISASIGTRTAVWSQNLTLSNIQNFTASANNQSSAILTSGSHTSSVSDIPMRYSYPLNLFSAYFISFPDPVRRPGSVYCMVDRSKAVEGPSILGLLTGTSKGPEKLATRQNVTSMYHWNETIVEGTPGLDTCDGTTWYSFEGSPTSRHGMKAYSRYLAEKNDLVVEDRTGWMETRAVPPTMPLPRVEGQPVI